MKKLIHSLRATLLASALMATFLASAHDFEVDGIYYKIISDTEVAVTYKGDTYTPLLSQDYVGSVNIPTNVTYNDVEYLVTTIGEKAFYECARLDHVRIPLSVTTIEFGAFYNCISLTYINIPKSVTTIGTLAFYGCSGITYYEMGDIAAWCNINFRGFGSNPLYYAHNIYINGNLLENLVIPESVTSINSYAFEGCTCLTSVTLPNSVTSIGDNAFSGCSNLASITLPNALSGIGNSAFEGCKGLTTIIIPNSVNDVGYDAFKGCSNLTSLTLGDSVTGIGSGAFDGCSNLTSFYIPQSVTSIRNGAFNGCCAIKEIIFQNGENAISLGNNYSGKPLFSDCPIEKLHIGRNLTYETNGVLSPFLNKTQLKEVTINSSVTAINDALFRDCSGLTSIVLPDALNSIGECAFWGCSGLTSINIPGGVRSIKNSAFGYCTAIKEINFEDGTEELKLGYYFEKGLFYDCPLEKLYLGRNLSYLCSKICGYSPFYEKTNLTELTISETVTSLGENAFSGCRGLTSVKIPTSINSIRAHAFDFCIGLTSVYITDLEAWCKISFKSMGANPLLYGHDLYLNGEKLERLVIPEAITSIKPYAFPNCTGLTSISIPSTVSSIGESAFYGCTGLSTILIPNSVKSIGGYIFAECSSLRVVNIPEGITSIPYRAFYNTSLEDVYLPSTVKTLGESCFGNTSTITKVVSLNATPPEIMTNSFDSETEEKAKLYVPKGSLNSYMDSNGWKEFVNISDDIIKLAIIPDATYGDQEIDLSQFAPAGVDLLYKTNDNNVVEINGSIMRIIGTGEVAIDATLKDDASKILLIDPKRSFKVNKANLLVTVADVSITQGQTLPEFTYIVEGLVYDDTVKDIEEMPRPICDVTEDSAPGVYPVTFTEGKALNYNLITKPAKVTVRALTIIELNTIPTTKYGDAPIDLDQYAPHNYKLEYQSSDDNIVKINGSMLHIIGAGKVNITAKVPIEYPDVKIDNPVREIMVRKADLSVTVANITIAQGQPLPEFSYIIEGFVNDDTVKDIEEIPRPICDVTEDSAPGVYTVAFTEGKALNYNITTKPAKVIVTAVEPPTSNIDDIDADNDDEIEVYDMKGIRLYNGPRSEARLAKGFYLVRQGNTVAKVYID